jgi:hypothetical protein
MATLIVLAVAAWILVGLVVAVLFGRIVRARDAAPQSPRTDRSTMQADHTATTAA